MYTHMCVHRGRAYMCICAIESNVCLDEYVGLYNISRGGIISFPSARKTVTEQTFARITRNSFFLFSVSREKNKGRKCESIQVHDTPYMRRHIYMHIDLYVFLDMLMYVNNCLLSLITTQYIYICIKSTKHNVLYVK